MRGRSLPLIYFVLFYFTETVSLFFLFWSHLLFERGDPPKNAADRFFKEKTERNVSVFSIFAPSDELNFNRHLKLVKEVHPKFSENISIIFKTRLIKLKNGRNLCFLNFGKFR